MYLRILCFFFIIASCFEDSPVNSSLESSSSPINRSLDSGELIPVHNYIIFNCENLDRSAGFPEFLTQVRQAIQLVLQDLQYGVASRHGYRAFFKSNAHLLFVQEVFQNITAGRDLQGRRPVIQCLNTAEQAPTKPSAYSMMCEPREGHELVRARGWRSQGLLALCPDFWTHPAFPNGTDDCPLIAGRRGFQRFAEDEDGSALTDTQFGILIRELVQMYNPLDEGPEEGSVNGANECLELSREQSIENAGNWALYAASVKAGCTRFPPITRLGT